MKKSLVITALVVSMGFLGLQQASANTGMGGGCQKRGPGYTQLDSASKAKVDKFYYDIKELRRQIFMKHAEKAALMNAATPDADKVAKLAGEIFDLRNTIHDKAKAYGVQDLIGWGGHGRGMGQGMSKGMMNDPIIWEMEQ